MCGINGIFWYDHADRVEEQTIQKMNRKLAHRGPDSNDVYHAEHIALGHQRLSIIDLSNDGKQPMTDSSGRYTMVFNGEIYNYRELRSELGPDRFRTQTDSEVILEAWKAWGTAMLHKLNGMFAIAIWDTHKKELFIARDRLGIKPLYFFHNEQYLVFSSEVRALLESGLVAKKLNRTSLVDYLRYQTVHPPQTMLQEVFMLLPGHHFTLSLEENKLECWWKLEQKANHRMANLSYDDLKKTVLNQLTTAVERRLVADVPFGAFLSGGIDSSAIVGLMSQTMDQKVGTFSVVFDESEFSESTWAQMVAKKFNTDHHEINLSPSDFLEHIPEALNAMDHPSGDGPNTYMVSKATKEAGITMALSGLGGDEIFAGYPIFKQAMELEKKKWLKSFPNYLRKPAAGVYRKLKPGAASDKLHALLSLEYFDLDHTYPISRQALMDRYILDVVDQKPLPGNRLKQMCTEKIGYGSPGYNLPLLSQVSVCEISGYMQNVLLRDTDQMSMAHALEVRVPFLDHELVEMLLGVRDVHKYPHTPKKLLTDSLGDLLPHEVVHRPKMGFTFPWVAWMKNELRDFCESRLRALGKRDGFSNTGIQKLWKMFLAGDPRITWARIWIMVVLEDWMQRNAIEA